MFAACQLCLSALFVLGFATTAKTYPATVEFDVVFPRNETYAPVELMPIIFDIQNVRAALPLSLAIEWDVEEVGGSAGSGASGIQDLKWANISTEPYFVIVKTNLFNGTEGSYALLWRLDYGNCCATSLGARFGFSDAGNTIRFTTKVGAPPPSLISGPDICPTDSVTFNITGTLPVQGPAEHNCLASCAVLAQPLPTPNPCAVQVDSAVAASILAIITAAACAIPFSSVEWLPCSCRCE